MDDNRAWQVAEGIEADMTAVPGFVHDRTGAAGLENVAVDFNIQPERPYEEERRINSSITLDGAGQVVQLDIRLPTVRADDATEEMVREALAAGHGDSALPVDTNMVVGGYMESFQPHWKFPHGGTATENIGVGGNTNVRASRVVDTVERAVDSYRAFLDARV